MQGQTVHAKTAWHLGRLPFHGGISEDADGSGYVLRPRDLLLAHREVLSQCGGREKGLRVVEIANKFPRVEAVLASIKEKYEYVGKTFSIVVPEKIEQIIEEGQALKHCLDVQTAI